MTEADKEKELTDLIHDRMADLLNRTATALKGEARPLSMHDWSDLPDVADRLRTQNQALREALKDAAASLQTISLLAGKQDCEMDSMSDVRGYARSRSIVAFTAAITQAEGGV